MAQATREFFEGLPARADASKLAGMSNSYLFDIDGAGKWIVRVENGQVSVQEGQGDADTTISASEETFMRIVDGEQNATSAFMMGKLKVSGDLSNAMKLQKLF